ncbi:MAG: hypothetical protein ACK4YU_12975, partial [Paracoccus sp. (in: a-proteobacteria)]
LRATTGIQVMIDDRPARIAVRLRAQTQFGGSCMIGADLRMPDGPTFDFIATIEASRDDGTPVVALMNPDAGLALDITGFGGNGAMLVPLAVGAPCEALVLQIAPARCRMGEAVSTSDCPYPVTYSAPPDLLGLKLSGDDQIEMGAAPTSQTPPTILAAPVPSLTDEAAATGALNAQEVDDMIWTLTEGGQ